MGHPYSQDADLNFDEQRLIELTDTTGAPGVVNAVVMAQTAEEADGIIDGFLDGKYAVPFDIVPPPIRIISANLRRYLTYKHRDAMAAPTDVKADYAQALDMLQKYAEGKMFLRAPLLAGKNPPGPAVGAFSSDSLARKFGRAKDGLG